MRGVAKLLNRKAMTLYRYARNRAALLDGVVELVLNDLSIDPAAADWRQELRELAGDFQRLALAHPNVVPLLVTLPRATPLGLRPGGHAGLAGGLPRATHSGRLHIKRCPACLPAVLRVPTRARPRPTAGGCRGPRRSCRSAPTRPPPVAQARVSPTACPRDRTCRLRRSQSTSSRCRDDDHRTAVTHPTIRRGRADELGRVVADEFSGVDQVLGDCRQFQVGRLRDLRKLPKGLVGGDLTPLHEDAFGLPDEVTIS